MPKALERKLKAKARKKGLTGKKASRYAYGALRKTGWVPGHQKRKRKLLEYAARQGG